MKEIAVFMIILYILFINRKNKINKINKGYSVVKNADYHLVANQKNANKITNNLKYFQFADTCLIITGNKKSLLTSKKGKEYKLPGNDFGDYKLYNPKWYNAQKTKQVKKTEKWKHYEGNSTEDSEGEQIGDIYRDSRLTYNITDKKLNSIAAEYLKKNSKDGKMVAVVTNLNKDFYKSPTILIKRYENNNSFIERNSLGYNIVYLNKDIKEFK